MVVVVTVLTLWSDYSRTEHYLFLVSISDSSLLYTLAYGMVWYGILGFNVPLDTV